MAKKKKEEARFTKLAIINSKKYVGSRDLLTILLADGVEYTKAEVDEILLTELNRKVGIK